MTNEKVILTAEAVYNLLKAKLDDPQDAAEALLIAHVAIYFENKRKNSNIDEYLKGYIEFFKEEFNIAKMMHLAKGSLQ